MSTLQTGAHYPISTKALPASWEVGYVGDFALEIQPGFASGKHNKDGQGIPHIRPYNIDRVGKLDLATIKYVAPEADAKRLHSGDVLFNNTNSPELIGKTSVVSAAGDWGFSNHMTRIVFSEEVSPRFAAYQLHYLWMTGYFLHNCVKHVNQASVSSKTLARSVPFVKPPRPLQEHIVAEIEKQFSRLDEAVANLKRVKVNLKRYKAAVLKAAVEGRLTEEWRKEHPDVEPASELLKRILNERRTAWNGRGEYTEPAAPDTTDLWSLPDGWIWATVEQLSTLVQYGSSAKCSEEAKGVPVLRMGNIENGKLLLNELKYLPKDHDEFPSLFLSAGDLLFNRTNSAELVGKIAVYRGTPTPCSFASYLIRVRLTKHCLPDFLSYYINSVHGRLWISRVISQQVGQANVNGTKLQALVVPLPPLAEQERIVTDVECRLSVIEKLDVAVEAEFNRAERLRQSILGHAFVGRVVSKYGLTGKQITC